MKSPAARGTSPRAAFFLKPAQKPLTATSPNRENTPVLLPCHRKEDGSILNLHPHSFEKILEICSSLEEPGEMTEMIESLDLLEKNIRYLRQRLVGKLARINHRKEEQQRAERQQLKKSLRVLSREKGPGDGEENGS
jgi:hypothetical protein